MSEVLEPVVELEAATDAVNALTIPDPVRQALVLDLGPIAGRIATYQVRADALVVTNEAEAIEAAALCHEIAKDIKAVKGHDVLAKIKNGLHKAHRQFTGLENCFIDPLAAIGKGTKGKLIAYQQKVEAEAKAEERRLQAIEDERARKEKAALEKRAASLKTLEKKEEALAAAAAVTSHTVTVQAPKAGVMMQKRWAVKELNLATFLQACIADGNLLGYVTIDMNKLARAKSANTMLTIPGVEFHQKVV